MEFVCKNRIIKTILKRVLAFQKKLFANLYISFDDVIISGKNSGYFRIRSLSSFRGLNVGKLEKFSYFYREINSKKLINTGSDELTV